MKNNSKDGDALLQRAELLIASGNYGDAERDLNQVRRLKPNSPETHYVLAKLHKARNATLSSRQELTETLRLNPTLGAVRVELTENLTNNNEPRAALDVINAAPESQRKAVPLVVQRNWANWALGNLTEMRKGIDQGLALKRSVDLLIQDGMWQLRAGRFGASRVSLEEALKVNPADVRALRILYESYKVENKESLGIEKVKEYAAKQTQSAPMQHFLGTTLMVKRDREGARKAFLAAKLADPQFVKGDLSLVQLDMLERKHQDARKKLETIIAADSGNTTARLWLANVQLLTKDHGASIQNFQKVVDENPRNADALNNLAFVLAEHGNRLDEALKYAEKAVEIAPEQPVYCDTLGWVLYRKGIYSSAVKYLERADKGNVVSKYHLAMAYAKAGDVRRGRSTLDAALKIDSLIAEAKTAQQVVSEVSPSGQAESQRQRFSHSPQF